MWKDFPWSQGLVDNRILTRDFKAWTRDFKAATRDFKDMTRDFKGFAGLMVDSAAFFQEEADFETL